MSVFEDILKSVDEADRTVINKYPSLRRSLEEMESKYATADSKLREWETWKADAWDADAGTTKSERAVREAYRLAQERNAALEAATGSEMTLEEILVNLNQKGYATKADVEAVAEAKAKALTAKLAEREYVDKNTNDLSRGFEHIYTKTYNLGRRHEKEFGEELDLTPVFKYMGENKITDPELAYNQMFQAKRAEIAEKKAKELEVKHQADIEAAKKAGEEAAKRSFNMGAGGKIPTDQGGTDQSLGHLQRRAFDTGKKPEGEAAPVPDKVKLGQGVLSNLGYEELLKNREAGAATQ